MTKIRILLYTDHRDVSGDKDADERGVSILLRLLNQSPPAFAELEPRLVNRFQNPQQPQKLDQVFLKDFDQIWFFGVFQKKIEQQVFNPEYGGLDNELDPAELAALEAWMKEDEGAGTFGGGVLIAGDHAEPDPTDPANLDQDSFLCLGRALGKDVIRAGQLRKWKGRPTNRGGANSFNTIKSGTGAEGDRDPQSLTLGESPHVIFLGRERTIDIFPDHGHEGEITIPSKPLNGDWPAVNGLQPEPITVALGLDRYTQGLRPVLAVYDGNPAGVGRIVADASWHHYMNVNLSGFNDDPDKTNLDLMGQFFGNLAVWLAPRKVRQEMSQTMFVQLSMQPSVKDERGNPPEVIGVTARHVLSKVATQCVINELLLAGSTGVPQTDAETLVFAPRAAQPGRFPSQELALGSVVEEFHWAALPQTVIDKIDRDVGSTPEELIETGMRNAFSLHAEELSKANAPAASGPEKPPDDSGGEVA